MKSLVTMSTETEIKSALVAKQRILGENENETSFTTWQQSIMFNLVVDNKFSRFTDAADLGIWGPSTAQHRGYQNDSDPVPENLRMTAAQKAAILKVLLGCISTFAPVISNKFITEQSTSLDSIFDRLRGHYGIRVTGGRILDLAQLSLKPNESYECLWERLSNFVEDNLLKRSSGIKHLNTRVTVDEDISISLLNVTVVLWLRAINPDLPMMVKQRFATQLRDNTLYSLREDISESLQAILTEMQDREYTVNLARGYQKRSNSRFKPKSDSFRSQFSKAKQKRSKLCCLCDAAGRRGADTHFLSECTFLPAEDKRYISSIRDVVEDSDEDQESDEGSCCAINSIPSVSRVDVMSSPILGVKYKDQDAAITADTGGELNLIALEEALRLKLKMTKASQRACMCDGESGVRVLGEVNFDCTVTCRKTKHTLKFHGLVVKKLSCPILGGQPFLFFNDVFARTAKQMIYLGDCCEWRSLDKNATSSIRLCKAVILRNPTKTCLLPGDKLSISVPHEYKSQPIAVEPRHISKSVSSVPDWLPYQTIESSSEGHVEIVNSSSEPVLIRKHEQFAQIRLLKTNDEMPTQSAPPMNKPPKAKGPFSIDVQVDPSKILNLQQREKFKSINQEFDNVFSPELGKYNGVSGPFEHHINMGPTLPPQQKGRNPQYNRNNLEALQMKIDELVIRGVLVKPEDVGVQVEYVSPSFLVKKSNGGHRLVTAFNQLAEFVKPQPTAMPNVDDVLRHIAQFKVLIKTDLKDAYYLIQMGKSSMKYTGIVSPFRGTFLYQRAVMGLPGSEASLECLLSRILGDIMMRGSAVKLADDLYVGADTVEQLMNIWYEVLRLMELNGLRLSPAKTVICPTSTIILGWQWEEGTIRPTPHRLNTLSQCEPPETVHKLRSFIGSYKALSKVIPYHSDYLADFDKLCSSDKPATDKVPWSDDLINKFERAKLHLKDAKTITLPRREDELQIVTDASAKGIAAALYSIRDGKPVLSGLFNAKRQKHHMGWLPCELEASLSITASVKHFSPYIIQSNHRVTVITDSLPCVSAYQKLSRGEFSMSPRVTTYLSTLSHYNIDVKHIAGVKNTVSDFASRNPIDCGGECQLCAFIESLEESVIRGVTVEEILSGAFSVPYTNRAAWRSLQQSCDDLKKVVSKLKSGSNPSRESGDVRKYLTARVKLSSRPADELLIVPSTEPLQPSRQRIVVPRGIVDGLLTALHLKLSHPSKSQLKLIFNRAYFSLSLDAAAARVTNGCHTCASLKKVPAMFIPQSTAPPPDYVGAKYSADVIKDNLQKILIVREYVSSYSDAVFIESENQEDLKEGLVKILSRMRLAGGPPVIVRVDPATPFVALTPESSNRPSRGIGLGNK